MEKKITLDRKEILENGIIQFRERTDIIEEDKIISTTYHRYCITPVDNYSDKSDEVKALCDFIFTNEVKEKYKASIEV